MSGKGPKTPSKKQQSEEQQTPSKQAAKKQDADQSNNKTPVKQTPKKEQQTPAKQQQQQQKDKTPAKQTPAKKQKAEESASETAAPAEPVKQTPVKQTPKKEKQTPAKQQQAKAQTPAKSQPQQTPSKKQDDAKPAATSTPSANKKQSKQDDKKRKRQEEEKKTQEENAAEEAEEAAEQENGTAEEDAEEKQPAAKKQKTADAKKDKKNKKQQQTERLDKNSPLLVTIENLTNSVSDAQLEEALKKKQLGYSALKRVNTKSAELLAASEAEFAKFMKVRTLSVNNTTIVFTSNIKDKKCLVFRNLAHDLTIDELKKYVQEIGTVKNITIFPPTAKQQYAKAAVEFEKNVADSALEFDGAEVKGLPCRVSFLSESNRWVYVTNLKLKVPDADLLGYFEEAGPVDYMFKVGNGAEAVVCYKTIKGAREALEYDGADIFGRPVRIFYQN